jgi:cation transport ATPase
MSLLVVLGTTAAYAYAFIDVVSDWSSEADTSGEHVMGGEHFFETSSTLITFVILGRYLFNHFHCSLSKCCLCHLC